MTPITEHVKTTKSQLRVGLQFYKHDFENIDNLIEELQIAAAQSLARKIVADQKFFSVSMAGDYGTMEVDVTVLTQKELDDLLSESFKKGLEHSHLNTNSYNRFLEKL
jgi:hypothetical protein